MKPLLIILLLASLVFASAPDVSVSGILQTTLGTTQGKTNVLKTGTLASSATTADQVLLTYTVTAGKVFYIQRADFKARLTTFAATATNFGNCSLESPAGTKLYTQMNAGTGVGDTNSFEVAEPIPISAGVVVRIVCTPSAATAMTWTGNIIAYER